MDALEELLRNVVKELGKAVINKFIKAIGGKSTKAMILLTHIEDPRTMKPSQLHSTAKNRLVQLIVELVSTYKFDVEGVDSDRYRADSCGCLHRSGINVL